MCRILLANKKEKFSPIEILNSFADMCEASRTPEEDDWQGDGWGVSWLDDKNNWETFKSINPIWKDREEFEKIPESTLFMSHARSKSFVDNELITKHNQPFVDQDLSYVFNGVMHGVALRAEGEIGSQKVFNIIKKYAKTRSLEKSLEKARNQINIGTKQLVASNIITCDKKNAYILCNHWGKTLDYHTIRYFQDDNELIISSEKLDCKTDWHKMENKEILTLKLY